MQVSEYTGSKMTKKIGNEEYAFTPVEELTYENALEELNAVVQKLEIEELSLKEALAYFERGQNLAQYCAKLLDQTELKVEQIIGEEMVDFEYDTE
jgi:exodeoxyribonuclease VII small subunit